MLNLFNIKKEIGQMKNKLAGIYGQREANAMMNRAFEHICGFPYSMFHINTDKINLSCVSDLKKITDELLTNKPLQYVLGYTEFYGLKIHVNKNALIPRPETEELVQWVIEEKKAKTILDIGTGSGCIAIALSKHLPEAKIYGCDISAEALETAKKNALSHNLDISFFLYDILKWSSNPIKEKFDVIVSNPPYICEKEKSFINKNVLDFEPHNALFVPDEDPLLFYKSIADFASQHLNINGKIFFEINEVFGNEVYDLLRKKEFKNVMLKKDINGKDRMVKGIVERGRCREVEMDAVISL